MKRAFLRGWKDGHVVERVRRREGLLRSLHASGWLFDREEAYQTHSGWEGASHFLGRLIGNTAAVSCGLLREIRRANRFPDEITIPHDFPQRKK